MLSQAAAATSKSSARTTVEQASRQSADATEGVPGAQPKTEEVDLPAEVLVASDLTEDADADLVSILESADGERQSQLVDAVMTRSTAGRVAPVVAAARSPLFSRRANNSAAMSETGVDVLVQRGQVAPIVAQETPMEGLPTLDPSDSSSDEDDVELPAEVAPSTEIPEGEVEDAGEPDLESLEESPEETPDTETSDENDASDDSDAPESSISGPEVIPSPAQLDLTGDSETSPNSLIADPNPLNTPTTTEEVDVERNPVITLEQAVDLAYRNNQTLQNAILTLEQSEAALAEQRAAQRPNVVTQATLSSSQNGVLNDDGSDLDTQLGGSVEINYSLLTGGARKASIRAAEIQRDVSALAVEAQQEQLRLTTATAYYALQDAGEQIRINRTFLNEAERNLRDSQLRQEVGVGTRFDTLRAEVQFANARQQVIQAEGNQRIARRDISRLLNLPPNAGIEATPVEAAETWPLTLEESIILAFQNRADLEQQLLQADLSEQQRQIALSAIRPQLSLFARYSPNLDIDGAESANPFFGAPDDFTDNVTVGANFSWTLYDGGAARAQARQQELAAEIAETTFSETQDQIRFDVEQAYFNLQSNQENIATSQVAVAQAEEALELANLRLQAGVGTQLDVLTAQSELSQAQANNVAAILGYNRALVSLERAISNVSEGL